MEQQSTKHGPNADNELKRELENTMRGTRQSHTEEWRQVEPSGEDQPDVDLVPDGTLTGGTPEGMSEQDVERRAEFAQYLGKEIWPAVRQQLEDIAAERNAPDWVFGELRRLPDGRRFENVTDVWSTLGHGVEAHRF